eukprot:CAMPEP_0172182282 /NCGR_PEP_ID=MMETSP1050-20130122/18314_1 /TAXON_ID=233186 /ORGANISM="Cryptomonas curvata, Strain CCAP979/52" /LENGTH=384 /DNA_ID=CAMNT_0012855713 /DNA_START=44 /DNA_END=1195 /DNA_ORIENTATION=-
MATRWHEDDIDGLDDLEEQLRALKREEELLCDAPSSATATPVLELQKAANAGPSFALHKADCRPSYSAVDPVKGDVRGYKRAQLIRRVGAVLALSLAVISAVTVTSSGEIEPESSSLLQKLQLQQILASAADVVPKALERDSSSLTASEKQLFQNRYEHLLDSERRHENWDMERATHLVHQIDAASVQNLKDREERSIANEQVARHREDFAARRADRYQKLVEDSRHRQAVAASEADRHKQILKQAAGQEAETDSAKDSVEARAEAAHARQERDFLEQRAHREQARENHQEAVEEAHESYEEARARAVEAKDALRSALTDRDALTEVLRSSPYTTKAQADDQLKNVQDKVDKLLVRTEATKKAWQAAHRRWFQLQDTGTWPRLG